MAQRTEKEETEFKSKSVPETLTLCVNNCGVVGNPATNNMCQNCFNSTTTTSFSSNSTSSQRARGRSGSVRSPARSTIGEETVQVTDRTVLKTEEEKLTVKVVNRCSGCRKRVGFTGFRCRCGDLFCGEHRYSDRHDCTFDYKSAGREAIARENPVVKAAKIVRI